MKLIDKDAVVAEIERRTNFFLEESKKKTTLNDSSCAIALYGLLSFINTLEVKEIVDYEEPDLNPIFEEMEIEPDSKIATAFRNAFYKGIDNFCKRKEN